MRLGSMCLVDTIRKMLQNNSGGKRGQKEKNTKKYTLLLLFRLGFSAAMASRLLRHR